MDSRGLDIKRRVVLSEDVASSAGTTGVQSAPSQQTVSQAALEVPATAAQPSRMLGQDTSVYQPLEASRVVLPVTEGMEEADDLLYEEVFKPLGLPSPYNANTTPALAREVGSSPEYAQVRTALGGFLVAAAPEAQAKLNEAFLVLQNKFPHGNLMELMYIVFRQSVTENVEDSKLYIKRLQSMNAEAEQYSKYLETLSDASRTLESNRDSRSDSKKGDAEVWVYPQRVVQDPSSPTGYSLVTRPEEGSAARGGLVRFQTTSLANEIKDVENKQDLLRNARSMVNTSFQNANEKRNQNFKLMTDVLKSILEGSGIGLRNML